MDISFIVQLPQVSKKIGKRKSPIVTIAKIKSSQITAQQGIFPNPIIAKHRGANLTNYQSIALICDFPTSAAHYVNTGRGTQQW